MIELIKKYNQPGPRYTSYPPATAFHDQFTSELFQKSVVRSNAFANDKISLYIHIPFCAQLCLYCGCNTQIGAKNDFIDRYIDCLLVEISNTAALISKNKQVSQIHWGGGTPNILPSEDVARIMNHISDHFTITETAEIAMECAPALLTEEKVRELLEIGFNRVSLGIQDFHPEVLKAVNRKPPCRPIEDIIAQFRAGGVKGLNLDLIYGLPFQTVESFLENLERINELRPDRLATFSYAHVPWAMPHQKALDRYTLPHAELKMEMLVAGIDFMKNIGYEGIGMDHYALPHDTLAVAKRTHTLHRNFQGYCPGGLTGQVYAFGASAISQLHDSYAQNVRNSEDYCQAIETTGFATFRGYELSALEMLSRDLITEIMCNAVVDLKVVAARHNLSVAELLEKSGWTEEKTAGFVKDGLMRFDGEVLEVNESGHLFVRNIAMAFDPALEVAEGKFSRTI